MARVLEQDKICEVIPHRHENVLIDRIELSQEDSETERTGRGNVCFAPGDREGRDIFIVKDAEGRDVYYHYMYMEFFALGAIMLMEEKVRGGRTAVFSSIRKVSFTGAAEAGTELLSNVSLKGVTSGFHRFAGTVEGNGEELAGLQIMAYGVDFSSEEMSAADSGGKQVELPVLTEDTPVETRDFAYKRPELVCADRIRSFSEEEIVTEFTYPENHPFTKGHFPGNPVMMGIMQVVTAADSGELLAGRCNREECEIETDSSLMRENGSLLCEVKGLSMFFHSKGVYPEPRGIKAVAFRDMVRPGEKLYCRTSLRRSME